MYLFICFSLSHFLSIYIYRFIYWLIQRYHMYHFYFFFFLFVCFTIWCPNTLPFFKTHLSCTQNHICVCVGGFVRGCVCVCVLDKMILNVVHFLFSQWQTKLSECCFRNWVFFADCIFSQHYQKNSVQLSTYVLRTWKRHREM